VKDELNQCQRSITEVSEQLSQFSVINGGLWRAVEFGRFCCGEPRNFSSWPAENCVPYILCL